MLLSLRRITSRMSPYPSTEEVSREKSSQQWPPIQVLVDCEVQSSILEPFVVQPLRPEACVGGSGPDGGWGLSACHNRS
jgi:hypothetical protein